MTFQSNPYVQLMRLDRPIGIYLLLWPTLWALWLGAGGVPPINILIIFVLGVVVMRSAGCVINDYADRHIDRHVSRTQDRPLTKGTVTERSALMLFAALIAVAALLVFMTNWRTVAWSFGALILASTYPFMKRYTHLPQVVLGAAFAWSIPMSFTALDQALGETVWLLYTSVLIWTVAYDTLYAMADREDDLKIGVKSTAVLFGDADRTMIALLQAMTIASLWVMGSRFGLGLSFDLALVAAGVLFVYQQHLIRFREPDKCIEAFKSNHWVGAVVFAGIALDMSF